MEDRGAHPGIIGEVQPRDDEARACDVRSQHARHEGARVEERDGETNLGSSGAYFEPWRGVAWRAERAQARTRTGTIATE